MKYRKGHVGDTYGEDLGEELRDVADSRGRSAIDGLENDVDWLADELLDVVNGSTDDVDDLLEERVDDVLRSVASHDGVWIEDQKWLEG